MRKILLFFSYLSLCLSLFAVDIYKSNELGQKLEQVQEIGKEGYYLKVENNTQTLIYNDVVYLTITTNEDYKLKTIIKEYSLGTTETYVYEDGLLKSISQEGNIITYSYIDNRLAFCIVNGAEIFFLRAKEDGSLIAIKRGSDIELLSDSYLYQNGSFYNIISNAVVLTGEYETLEDGSFNIVEGDKTYHYSQEGLLINVESEDEKVEYTYLENKVSSIKTTYANNTYQLESYENDSLIKIEQYSASGLITALDDYSTGKLIRTVYKDGRAVADIYYKEDNVSVENIKYR